jgi:hypothetical protein
VSFGHLKPSLLELLLAAGCCKEDKGKKCDLEGSKIQIKKTTSSIN